MDEGEFSLADFYFPDGDDPFVPPKDYSAWMERSAWALSLMEPRMRGPAGPRLELDRANVRRPVINLSSYNYLGLTHHPEVVAGAAAALEKYGTGACGSPLLSGMTDLHRELETKLASFLQREDVMLFNSGFGGGMGSLAAILRKGDVAVLDAKAHLCLVDGVKLAGAKLAFFDHNDPDTLEQQLTATEGKRRVVVVEGVYSMDGDTFDAPRLMPVIRAHRARMFIDEAHSILVYGKTGRGVVEHFGLEQDVALQYATFSKSFAGGGGFVSGSRELLRYMRYYANNYGFSCALPPSVVGGLLAALHVATRDDSLRVKLWDNVAYFRERARGIGLDLGDSTSQVFPIIIGGDRRALYEMALAMHERGLFLAPVDYPSVPDDSLRYRVAITAAHTRVDLDEALQILEDVVIARIGRKR
jgi:glycine C-acetyltransferase